MKRILFFALIAIATLSCTPKSAMITKAVVLDNKFEESVGQYNTKLVLIEYGVVYYQFSYQNYEIGDTIFVHDPYRNSKIQ